METSGARWCVTGGLLASVAVCCASAPLRARAQARQDERRSIFEINVPVDATVIGASVALALVPPLFGDSIVTPSCPCDPHSVNAIDRGTIGNSSQAAATISEVTEIAAVAAPVGFELVTLGPSSAFLEDTIVFGQTVLVSNALVNVVKLTVQRPRPAVYATTHRAVLEATDSYVSFYSGHTTITFAALSAASMILHLRYGTTVWPWVVTLLVGSSVAVERVLAGKHFPTDVTVGAITGVAEGIVIPYLHARRSDGAAYGLGLVPITAGAELVWCHAF